MRSNGGGRPSGAAFPLRIDSKIRRTLEAVKMILALAAFVAMLTSATSAGAAAATAVSVQIPADDPFNNVDPGLSDQTVFYNTDFNATLPAVSSLTKDVGTFSATLTVEGNETISAQGWNSWWVTSKSPVIAVVA